MILDCWLGYWWVVVFFFPHGGVQEELGHSGGRRECQLGCDVGVGRACGTPEE